MKKNRYRPAKTAEKILSLISSEFERDAIVGDFRELFREKAEESGSIRAHVWYWSHLSASLPAFLKWMILTTMAIVRSNIKTAWRNLYKNKTSTFINIFGLSLAIGISIVMFVSALDRYGKDTFHEHADSIFLIESNVRESWGEDLRGDTPVALGPQLAEDFPQIQNSVRIHRLSGTVFNNRYESVENILFADKSFFEVFTFPLVSGSEISLSDINSVFISERYAEILFGRNDPLGKQISIGFTTGKSKSGSDNIEYGSRKSTSVKVFTVNGVFMDVPRNASYRFDIILPYQVGLEIRNIQDNSWQDFTAATFVQTKSPADVENIKPQMESYIEIINGLVPERPVIDFVFDPLLEMALNAHDVTNSLSSGVIPLIVIIRISIGLLLLLLPCINYINISIAGANLRLKEIGLRRVIGGKKSQLRWQFITENVLLCFVALILGILFCNTFLLPHWNELTNDNLYMDFSSNANLWYVFIGILFVTGIGAGSYPAFYITRFKPVNILRGNQDIKAKNRFTWALTLFQFVFTFFIMTITLTARDYFTYAINMDWGYDNEQTVVFRINESRQFDLFRNELASHPAVQHISGTSDHVGMSMDRLELRINDDGYYVEIYDIGTEYFETMGFSLIEGTKFQGAEADNSIIVNETFINVTGLNLHQDNSIELEGKLYTIIGIVQDFHSAPPSFAGINPTMFRVVPDSEYNFVVVRLTDQAGTQVINDFETIWTKVFPGFVYNPVVQKSVFDKAYKENDGEMQAFEFTVLANLIISCMGLFAIVSLKLSTRKKEIGIHKVLGSSMVNIITLLNRDLLRILLTSLIIAIPLTHIFLRKVVISEFPFFAGWSIIPYLFASVVLIVTAFITVSGHIYKAASENPIDALRSD